MKKTRTKHMSINNNSEDYYDNYRSKLRSNSNTIGNILLKTPDRKTKIIRSPDKSPIREGFTNKYNNIGQSSSKIQNFKQNGKILLKTPEKKNTLLSHQKVVQIMNPFSKIVQNASNSSTVQQPLNYLNGSNSLDNYLTEYEEFLEKRRSYDWEFGQKSSDNITCGSHSSECSENSLVRGLLADTSHNPYRLSNLLNQGPQFNTSSSEENENNSLEESFNKTLDFMEADLENEILQQVNTPSNSQKVSKQKSEDFTFTPIKLPENRCSKIINHRNKRSNQAVQSPVAINPLKGNNLQNCNNLSTSESCEKLRKISDVALPVSKLTNSYSSNAILKASENNKSKVQQTRKRCYPAESPMSISKHLDFKKLRI